MKDKCPDCGNIITVGCALVGDREVQRMICWSRNCAGKVFIRNDESKPWAIVSHRVQDILSS